MGPTPAKDPTIPKVLVWDEMRPVTEAMSILMHKGGSGLVWPFHLAWKLGPELETYHGGTDFF